MERLAGGATYVRTLHHGGALPSARADKAGVHAGACKRNADEAGTGAASKAGAGDPPRAAVGSIERLYV